MKLSIIIPVYNERDTISQILGQVQAVDVGTEKEIIVLDGCSTDGTQEILEQWAEKGVVVFFEKERRGKGAALKQGFALATGDLVVIQDADLEVSPDEYPRLLAPILAGEAHVVYGSRFATGRGLTRWPSYLGNQVVTQAVNLLFRASLTDVATCHKVIPLSVIQTLDLESNGFELDIEITARLLASGYNILEIPIGYHPRDEAAGKKMQWIAGWKALKMVWRCRFSSPGPSSAEMSPREEVAHWDATS